MQPGGRRGDRAFVPREHRLVIAAYPPAAVPAGRAIYGGNASAPARRSASANSASCRLNASVTPPSASRASTVAAQIVGALEAQLVARMQAARVAGQRVPGAVGARPIERDADARLAAPRGKLRRDHPRIVGHQHIARPQQVGQIAHHAVRAARRAPRAAAARHRAGGPDAARCDRAADRSRNRPAASGGRRRHPAQQTHQRDGDQHRP